MNVCTVIVLSKPGARRAQLDLLLRSLDRYWPGQDVRIFDEPAGPEFAAEVWDEVDHSEQHVCFLTDDGVFYRPVFHPEYQLAADPLVLCHSLRLGANTSRCYPTGQPQRAHAGIWSWVDEALNGDYGYPGSLDAHLFRRTDLLVLLGGPVVPTGPNQLETVLDDRCWQLMHERRPLMSCPTMSCYVSVPVNRVSEQSGVQAGVRYPQPARLLDDLFDSGIRLDLASIRPELVDGAHVELPYLWEPKPALVAACG